ncbi:MAG: Rrf2 family transcriptional regulator [Burkholderiales bacterium]|jgi:Rrf2 family protein|nr:Rrf2 family transcriptional regulator [Burkholderiales bacterium]
MRLQKNTLLALYSVLESAGEPETHIAAVRIADKYGVSSHHLAKVLAELARAGILESVRGAGGGYRFAGNPRRLTLMDIIQMFEEFSPPVAQRNAPGEVTPVDRALGVVLAEIDENAKATFSSITLATLLRLIDKQQGEAAADALRGEAVAAARPAAAPRTAARKPSARR